MTFLWALWMFAVAAAFCGTFAALLFDGSKRQPTWKEVLIRRCEEQHAALMRGDMTTGVHGRYPPVRL